VICLQETFVEYFVVPTCLSQFEALLAPAVKISVQGRRSGGSVTLVHNSIRKYVHPLYNDNNIVCVKITKAAFCCPQDLLLFNVYNPPPGSPWYNLTDADNGIHILEQVLLELTFQNPDCHIVICGDLNSRTGYLNSSNDFDASDISTQTSEESRMSQDTVVNENGSLLLTLCLSFDLTILNGSSYCYDHRFTYIAPTGNITIDYFLVSNDFTHHCTSLVIKENVVTKHMSLELTVSSHKFCRRLEKQQVSIDKFVWDKELQTIFLRELESLGESLWTND